MNEVQRMQYLDALGIDSFMPRRILPNAPVAQLCAPVMSYDASQPSAVPLPAAQLLTGNSQSVSHSPALKAPVIEAAPANKPPVSAAALLDTTPAAPPRPVAQVAELTNVVSVTAAKPDKVVEPAPRFSLSLWQLSDQLLVVDSRQPQQALPTESLLANILSALGYPQAPLPPAHVVRWPIIENRFEPQGADEARGMLSALLSARLESQPVKHLLLMGEQACHYILPSEHLAETQSASLEKLQGKLLQVNELVQGLPVIVVPSLTDMLQDASLKAITWQAIQPLRQ